MSGRLHPNLDQGNNSAQHPSTSLPVKRQVESSAAFTSTDRQAGGAGQVAGVAVFVAVMSDIMHTEAFKVMQNV